MYLYIEGTDKSREADVKDTHFFLIRSLACICLQYTLYPSWNRRLQVEYSQVQYCTTLRDERLIVA